MPAVLLMRPELDIESLPEDMLEQAASTLRTVATKVSLIMLKSFNGCVFKSPPLQMLYL